MRATLRGGETYRLFGNRGTARYVGLQTMDGIAATTNCLVDDLEVDADGNFEAILSADEHEGNWLRVEGDHPTLDGAELLLRLGHREAVVAADRAHRRRGRAEGSLGRSGRLGVASAVRAGGVRLRQPEVLPRLQRDAAGQRIHAADGHVRDRRRRRKPARHRPIRTRSRRSADPRGRTAQGRLLELLAGQPVVGDDPLRSPPVQPQRSPGDRRSRRRSPRRRQLAGSGCGELARHRRA